MIITEVCEWTWRHFFSHSHAPKHKADYCKSRTNLQYEMMSSIHTENTDDYDFWFSDRKNARKQKSYKILFSSENLLCYTDSAQLSYDSFRKIVKQNMIQH